MERVVPPGGQRRRHELDDAALGRIVRVIPEVHEIDAGAQPVADHRIRLGAELAAEHDEVAAGISLIGRRWQRERIARLVGGEREGPHCWRSLRVPPGAS